MEEKNYDYGAYKPELLNAMPAGAGCVLEIGCNGGALGAAYKKANPGSVYYGVELNKAAAAHAAMQLDMVLCGSVDEMDLDFLAGKVDCIVYGDVLEHLYDPWSTLKSHAKLLKPTGVINASIPNVQHWSLLDHVMRGQWNYTDHGLLDDTHIRFFTLATMGRMFANAGLKVDSVFGVNIFAERGLQFCEAMRPALATLGIDFEEFRSKSLALQYVLTASPAA